MGKDKKEIGKLLELLNEYEYFKELKEVPEEGKDLFVQKNFWHELYGVLNSYGCEDYEILKRKFCYMYAISKEYGFIKWLVENDKIDFYTILKENGTFRKEFYAIENRKEYERLIMLLSVEDEPINFLISILK